MDPKKTTNDSKSKKKKKKSVKKTVLMSFLIFLLILAATGTGVLIAVIKTAPNIDADILNNLSQSSMIYDKDNKSMSRVSGGENRSIVPISEIPKNLQNAFVAIEDERFYSHHGIDVKRVFGAIFNNIKTMSKSQGASTITQQLIKNYALTNEKKFTRKLQEMYLALQLEKKLTKEQILEAYMNTIFLGGNDVYGVQSAYMHYFGDKKSLSDLSLAECALLAGITQNPSKYYPYSERNKKDGSAYIERQRTVLAKMLENGFITQSEYDKAKSEKLVFKDTKPIYSGKYHWFIEPALSQITDDLAAKEGISKKEARNVLSTGGYKIYLTIDTALQDAAQKVVNTPKYYSGLYVSSEYKNYSPNGEDKKIQPQAAAAIYDYSTGEMRAIIGGRGEHSSGSKNRATEIKRQPGSAIKPLSVYAPAFDRHLITPSTIIKGTKLSPDEAEGFSPGNSNGQFPDSQSAGEALIRSTNTIAVRIEVKVGKDSAMDYLKNKFHFSTLEDSDKYYPALALGGMTNGLLATEMAAAYGVFGNDGDYTRPVMYSKVVDRNDNIVLENKTDKSKAISSTAAFTTLNLMEDVVTSPIGTGRSANFGGMPVAGKTGTTNEYKTVWFAGLTPYYSGAVWIGHDKPSLTVSNLRSETSARLWGAIMAEAHKGLAYKDFKRPAGFQSTSVCPVSGKLFTDFCKEAGQSPNEKYFSPGNRPSQYCDVHTGTAVEEPKDNQNPSTETPPTTDNPSNGGTNGGGTNPPNGGNSNGGGTTSPGGNSNGGETTPPNGGNSNGGGTTPPNGNENTTPPTALNRFLNSIFSFIF